MIKRCNSCKCNTRFYSCNWQQKVKSCSVLLHVKKYSREVLTMDSVVKALKQDTIGGQYRFATEVYKTAVLYSCEYPYGQIDWLL